MPGTIFQIVGNSAKNASNIANEIKQEIQLIKGGEKILEGVKSYEQARNIAFEIIGDLGDDSIAWYGGLKESAGEGLIIGRKSMDSKLGWRLDFDPQKGIHINVVDFTKGKGSNAVKIAIPFAGDEATYKALLKHLNK